MRKAGFFMTALALIAGAAGFFLRRQEVATVFDPHTGLASPGEPISILLMMLSGITVLLLFAFCLWIPQRRLSTFEEAFEDGGLLSPLLTILGVLVIFATVLEAVNVPQREEFILLAHLQTAGAILSGVCLAYMAIRGPRGGSVAVAAAVPVFWICLWLVDVHIREASNPVLLRHVYGFFALSALLLGIYYVASFAFHQGKVKKLLFTSSVAIYFTGVTMGDVHNFYQRALLLALAGTLLLYHLALASAVSRPEPEEPPPYIPPPVSEHKKPFWDVDLDEGE